MLIKTDEKINLREHEFRWWSQHGEDGVLEVLTKKLPVSNTFIEIGAHFHEANCLKLRHHKKWRGVFFDDFHEFNPLGFYKAWVTAENINGIIASSLYQHKLPHNLGILSIDIDGNDLWLWNAVDHKICSPSIVIMECNMSQGIEKSLTMPYDANYKWDAKAEVGSTPLALYYMGQAREYDLCYIESTGVNMFFVHKRHNCYRYFKNVNDLEKLTKDIKIKQKVGKNLMTIEVPKFDA